jgi:hypothetical protein
VEVDEMHVSKPKESHTMAVGRNTAGRHIEVWVAVESNQGRGEGTFTHLQKIKKGQPRRELACAMSVPTNLPDDDMKWSRSDVIRRLCLMYLKGEGCCSLSTDGLKEYILVAAILGADKTTCFHKYRFVSEIDSHNNTVENRNRWGRYFTSKRYFASPEWIEREWNFRAWLNYYKKTKWIAVLELLCSVYGSSQQCIPPPPPHRSFNSAGIREEYEWNDEKQARYKLLLADYEKERQVELAAANEAAAVRVLLKGSYKKAAMEQQRRLKQKRLTAKKELRLKRKKSPSAVDVGRRVKRAKTFASVGELQEPQDETMQEGQTPLQRTTVVPRSLWSTLGLTVLEGLMEADLV